MDTFDTPGNSQDKLPFADGDGQGETTDMGDGGICEQQPKGNNLDEIQKKFKKKIAQLKNTVKDLRSENSSLKRKIGEKGQHVSLAKTQTNENHNDEELKKLYEQKDKKEAEIKELVLRIHILLGKDGKVQQKSVETQTDVECINEVFKKNNENEMAKMSDVIARIEKVEKDVRELKSHPSFSTRIDKIGQYQFVTDEYAKEDQTQMKLAQNAKGNKHSKQTHEVKNETNCTTDLNLNGHSTTRKLDRIVYVYIKSPSEATKMLKRQLMEILLTRIKNIKFVEVQNIDDIEKGPPLIAICVNTTRMKTDATNSIHGIRELKDTVLVVFHHIEHHAVMALQSSQSLSGQPFSGLAGIYYMAFLQENGIYSCDTNTKAADSIAAFLTKQYPKPSKGFFSLF